MARRACGIPISRISHEAGGLDSDNRTSLVMIRVIAADADRTENRIIARANQYPTGYGHDFPVEQCRQGRREGRMRGGAL
jgi:hypothetical protein